MFSLKRQISRFVMIGIIIIMLLTIIALSMMVRSYQVSQNEKRMNDLAVCAQILDDRIIQMSNAIGSIYADNKAFDELKGYRSAVSEYDNAYEISGLLQIQVRSSQNLGGLFVYYDNAQHVIYSLKKEISFTDKEILKNTGKTYVEKMNNNYESAVITGEEDVYYNVILKKAMAAVMGCVVLNPEKLENRDSTGVYGILYEERFYGIIGELPEEEQNFSGLAHGRNVVGNRVIYLQKLEAADLALVEIVPQSPWLYFSGIHIVIAILMAALIYLLIRFNQFIYYQISKPLADMTQVLGQIRMGEWEVEFNAPNRIIEIEDVRQTVSIMLKEIERYKIRSYEEALETQKTQLQYLKLQLAPHFYTNCLKNAYYTLMLREYDSVGQFLLCLSTHLRYLLQKDAELVTLQEESDFVRNYFNLQKLMTTKSVDYELLIEDEILEESIPILSIQTFVENSFKYGRNHEGGTLIIRIRIQYRKTENGKYLSITVQDNGPGYSKEMLELLNEKEPLENQELGVGVLNLLKRVRIHYGTEAHWYFENTRGAFSELLLPMKDEKFN